jgi:hypothetical protein
MSNEDAETVPGDFNPDDDDMIVMDGVTIDDQRTEHTIEQHYLVGGIEDD